MHKFAVFIRAARPVFASTVVDDPVTLLLFDAFFVFLFQVFGRSSHGVAVALAEQAEVLSGG